MDIKEFHTRILEHPVALPKSIGASLSEPHIDELHVRNLYIIIIYCGTRAPLYALYTMRDIFRRPHEETSALSGIPRAYIINAESAKQIHSVCLSFRARERPSGCNRDLGHAWNA